MRRVLGLVENAFKAHGQGRVQMPAKIYLHLGRYGGDFRAMPAYIEGGEACGIKWVNVHPENKKHGLPAVMALIVLSSAETGFPLAVMDGTHITNLRTGAAGAIAAKYLANKKSSRAGLVGCGAQGLAQLLALGAIFRLKEVSVYDRDREHARLFVKKAMPHLRDKINICASAEECVRNKDIVVTTTPSRKPIIYSEWISPGTHINAIGADAKGKEELDPAILLKAKIFVDDLPQSAHSGEINVPLAKKMISASDIHATLGEVIAGKKTGRSSRNEITVFDSTGLAVQDIAVADYVYKAVNRRYGSRVRKINFIG